ncbi:hypothetical protein IB275_30505 [Pseudomonas sp. PDM21]|uniref:hypothetical protein n=1 Tax=Pseudomonas sp. PDM21 TaxID=2769257 RepID=UPI00177DE6A5|nr:hypothetical protein [Pseudomonas sp. PDM21]MBD9674948.1 hypothetical protein [Pseudomonas sp. PDM21]
MTYTVAAITTEPELRFAYAILERGCARIAEREGKGYFAPAVYADVQARRAVLFLVYDGPEEVGCFVCKVDNDSRTPTPKLIVSLAYIEPGEPDAVMQAGLDKCREFAADVGCTRIRFHAVRRGWEKRALELGYELVEYVYERGV